MEIKKIPINKITPDKNQPRQIINKERIAEMAQSIREEGLINPIEVDKDNVIVTGEMRWRACKEAGLTEIPCRVIESSGKERFLRQIIENVHHNTMNAVDTAEAYQKVIDLYFQPPEGRSSKGITWLSKKTGKTVSNISDTLSILGRDEAVIEHIKDGGSYTFFVALNGLKGKQLKAMEKKVLKKEITNRDVLRKVAAAVYQNPDQADALISQDFSKATDILKALEVIKRIVPDFSETPITDMRVAQAKKVEELERHIANLTAWLKNNPVESIGKLQLNRVAKNLIITQKITETWLQNKLLK